VRTTDLGWKSKDGLELYARLREPEGRPKAVVCLLHGLGEHVGRYEHVGEALVSSGYALMGFDQRGHGRSAGPRGYTPSYEFLMEDTDILMAHAGERYPGARRFLYGHSLGGNEAITYAIQRKPDLAGVIVTGPMFRLGFPPPVLKVTLGRLMNYIYPKFTQPTGLETAALSRDRKVVDLYISDPLVHDKITSRLFVDMMASGKWSLVHAADLSLPLLLMHGSADRLASPDGSREFARKGGKNITFHIFEDWYHEIHNEPDQADVFKMMTSWMDSCLER